MPPPRATECWYLTGPTASGKTGVGLELAARIGAEIVSMDSMALYRRLDIGTAKATAPERQRVPHHLIDILDPHEEFSLSQYLEAAQSAIDAIRSRVHQVLFVGGTPLYLKGLLRGIFRGPPADWEFRRRLEADACAQPPGHLHRCLAAVDPAAAARLHPNDTRRLIRALEVFHKTGQPISTLQREFDTGLPAKACRVFVLDWHREVLWARIDRRVERMFAAGLVEEVRRLLARPQPLGRTASQALGYREVIDHLSGGPGLAETIDLVKTHTRQFAKRQMTWFRSLSECHFMGVVEPMEPGEVAGRIAEMPNTPT